MKEGSAVKSRAGSDAGRTYIVTGMDGKYAYVSDGKRHKLSEPKKKNIRHLIETGQEVILPKTDAQLQTIIRRLEP